MRPEEVRDMEIEMSVYGEGAPDRIISQVFTIEANKRYVLNTILDTLATHVFNAGWDLYDSFHQYVFWHYVLAYTLKKYVNVALNKHPTSHVLVEGGKTVSLVCNEWKTYNGSISSQLALTTDTSVIFHLCQTCSN